MLLTAEQVAEQLQVSAYSVYALARDGKLSRVLIGRSVRFRPEDVATFVENCAEPVPSAINWGKLR